jgi:DNA-binding GntR family transcriptional regulator
MQNAKCRFSVRPLATLCTTRYEAFAMLEAKRRTVEKRSSAIARPKPLHEAVVERLRDMIVEGDLAPGERLNDAKLAALLNVSRTPIREAIKLLANEGLAELLPGRGARVSPLALDTVGELFEVIAGLERHACELGAERMSEREAAHLTRLHERMARHFEAGDRRSYFKLNHEIHLALVAASGNALLQGLHATLIARARRVRYAALDSNARWTQAMGEHEALMRALNARDARRAGEIMQEHDRRTAQALLKQLGEAAASPDAHVSRTAQAVATQRR